MRSNVEQLPSGNYRARYYDPSEKKWIGKTFVKKGDAKDWLNDVGSAMNKGEWVSPTKSKITFKDWAEQFWSVQTTLRPKTMHLQEGICRNHLAPYWGDQQLDEIGAFDVTKWAAFLAKQKQSVSWRHKCYWLMHKMMQAAVDAGLLVRSPFPDRAPLEAQQPKEPRVLTADEIDRLAAAAGGYGVIIYVMAFGGFRIGEVCAFRMNDLDFERGAIRVDETQVDLGGRISYAPPKTKKSNRVVTLPWQVVTLLAEYVSQLPKEMVNTESAFVFRSPEGEPIRASNFSKRHFAKAVEKAKLGKFTPHDLRHTAVSTWISLGATALQVAERAGHESVATVYRVYGHLFASDDDKLRTAMDGALTKLSRPRASGDDSDGVVVPMRRRS